MSIKKGIISTIEDMTKENHVIVAEEMADRIFATSNHPQLEMLEIIRKRVIKQHQVMLDQLRGFNKNS